MPAIVTRGNAADLYLPDETVDLICCSPPYFGLRSYQDGGTHYAGQVGDEATPAEYLDALIACTREWVRCLKPGGSIFVNLGDKYAGSAGWAVGEGAAESSTLRDKGRQQRQGQYDRPVNKTQGHRPKSLIGLPWRYAIRCIDDLGLILRAEIVWSKPNGLPESVTDRVRRSHEQVFHLVKQPRYYSAVDEVREEHRPDSLRFNGTRQNLTRYTVPDTNNRSGNDIAVNPLGKLPGSVWSIPTAPLTVPEHLGVDHFACVDDETEVLTRRGWLTHDQLFDDDEVAGFDLDTGVTQWTLVLGIHRYAYAGDLITTDARGLSMRLTPNHRTLVHRHAGKHRTCQPVEVIRADEVTKQHAVPRAVEWSDDGREKAIGVNLAALCGWVAAEGWVEGKRVRLSQSATANPLHVATIHDLLARLGGAHQNIRERVGGRGTYTDVTWTLPPALAAEVLRLMPHKLLPLSFVDLPMDEARALLEAFIAGDGHDRPNGRRAIFQKLRPNLDVLQAIAVRCGYNTTLAESGERWVLYLNSPRPARLRRSDGTSLVGREHYKGTVWCVTTGTGTFVARRRGTVFVTGNSYPPELVRRIVLGWSPREVCTACGEGRRPVAERIEGDGRQRSTTAAKDPSWQAINRADWTENVRRLITGYACACHDTTAPATPGVVLDPFGGTGTTALVASVFGRVGISVDLSADYCRLARWRTTDPGERARVLGVAKPPLQVDGQLGMFEGLGA